MVNPVDNVNSVSSSFNTSAINNQSNNDTQINQNEELFNKLEKGMEPTFKAAERGREDNKRFEEELKRILG